MKPPTMRKPLLTLIALPAVLTIGTWAFAAATTAAAFPALDHQLGNARVTTSDNTLTVSTGAITQQWTLVPTGLATTSLKNPATGKEWCIPGNTVCDWGFYGLLDNEKNDKNKENKENKANKANKENNANLVSLTAGADNDEGFAGDHIRVMAEFEYPAAHISVRYEIRAYPDAQGLMTRLWLKGEGAKNFKKSAAAAPRNDVVIIRPLGKKPCYTPFSCQPPQPDWFNSVARNLTEPLNVALDNLDPSKSYRIGMSFFNNVSDETIEQSVKLISGKQTFPVMDKVVSPPCRTSKAAPAPQTIFFDLPAGKLTSKNATLVVANKKAGNLSMASEVIVYEKSDKPSIREIMSTVPARIPQLVTAAPAGYRLVGYGSLGGRIGNIPAPPNGYTARLPIAAGSAPRLYGGYFADTQNRNTRETPLLHEDTCTGPVDGTERVGWASFVALQNDNDNGNDGLVVLKESHKCVNSHGCDTGDFTLDATSLTNTGLGMEATDIKPEKYTRAWANWTILYSGGDVALAIKKFDRVRFPLTGPLKLMSNFWGSSLSNKPSPHYAAREENILKEIASGADLGVEVVQIDDGWQGPTFDHWRPIAYFDTARKYPAYPEGWKNVREAAAKAGLELGLWSAEQCPLKDLVYNYDQGDFRFFKIDFLHMNDRARIDEKTDKARQLILHTGRKAAINWDLTEIVPRVGVYYAREYGNLFLENRRPGSPLQVTYVPYLVLRDAWHMSKYVNLNKVQIDIQNLDIIPGKLSNARQHDQAYATAIALMSSPLFFCETQYFDEATRAKLRPLIAAWRNAKTDLARGYVDPIGSEPDDASWTGFQNHPDAAAADGAGGYLMIFRELNNKEPSHAMALKYCAGKTLRLTDLMTGKTSEVTADKAGNVIFTMEKAGDYRFYKYGIID